MFSERVVRVAIPHPAAAGLLELLVPVDCTRTTAHLVGSEESVGRSSRLLLGRQLANACYLLGVREPVLLVEVRVMLLPGYRGVSGLLRCLHLCSCIKNGSQFTREIQVLLSHIHVIRVRQLVTSVPRRLIARIPVILEQTGSSSTLGTGLNGKTAIVILLR